MIGPDGGQGMAHFEHQHRGRYEPYGLGVTFMTWRNRNASLDAFESSDWNDIHLVVDGDEVHLSRRHRPPP